MIDFSGAVKQLEDWLHQRSVDVNHRQLILLCGEKAWSQPLAEQLLQAHNNYYQSQFPTLWLGSRVSESPSISTAKAGTLLGRQHSAVCYSTDGRIDIKALLIAAGTITSQGLLIMLCPALELWSTKLTAMPGQSFGVETSESHFIQYWQHQLLSDPYVAILQQGENDATLPFAPAQQPRDCRSVEPPFLSRDQQTIAQALKQVLSQPEHQTRVLMAKRGRGKTWLTGWFISQCLTHDLTIALISSKATAVEPIFRQTDTHARKQLLAYYAPDEAITSELCADLVVIDEASSIPIPMLENLCSRKAHILITTTTDGYEGTGSGFVHRLLPLLRIRPNNLKELALVEPVRWQSGDKLEDLLDSSLCIADEDLDVYTITETDSVAYELIDGYTLSKKPNTLRQIFNLLKQAHYQTTPHDFVRLIDARDSFVLIAHIEQTIVGVAAIIEEGNASLAEIANDIARGSRRPNGHMSLQMCSYQTTAAEFSYLRAWRINRIAVAQTCRRNGIASGLLNTLASSATANQINVLTTVFGKRDSLTDFWRRNEFFQFYQGEKRDKASGAVNVLWVKPLSTDAQTLFERYMVLPVDAHLKKVQDFIDKTRPLSAIRQSLLVLEHELDQVKQQQHGQLINLLTSRPYATEADLCSSLNLNGKQALYDLTRGLLKHFMEMRT